MLLHPLAITSLRQLLHVYRLQANEVEAFYPTHSLPLQDESDSVVIETLMASVWG